MRRSLTSAAMAALAVVLAGVLGAGAVGSPSTVAGGVTMFDPHCCKG